MTNASTITRQDVLAAKAAVRATNKDLITRITIRASQRNGFTLNCNPTDAFTCHTLAEVNAYCQGVADAEGWGDEVRPAFTKDTAEAAAHAAGVAHNGGAYDDLLDEEEATPARRFTITIGGKAA